MYKYALIDIGNTNVKLAFVENDVIQNKLIFETAKFKEVFNNFHIIFLISLINLP